MAPARSSDDLAEAFRAIAARHPSLPAVRPVNGLDVTYAELAALANRLARWLLSRHAGPGRVVAIQNSKTVEGYATMLAALAIGAAYVNLDVGNPPARLGAILSACRPTLVVCDSSPAASLIEAAAHHSVPLAFLQEHAAEIAALDPTRPTGSLNVTGADPAYVMFTSGSTGVPKGATISRDSVANFVVWIRDTFDVKPGDVVANANPIYFDNSVFDFYAALFTGACLAPITSVQLADPRGTVRRVDEAGCTVWFSVPSLLIYLMTMKVLRPETFASVRTIIFGGEGYPKSELAKLFRLYGGRCGFYNVYGPTECTCICSAYRISADDLEDGAGLPPLGRIAENFSYVLLDGEAEVTPGAVGELCLMGPQLALGYYSDPQRTRLAFVQNPLEGASAQRMYRTGDLVREAAGLLHFVGRRDNQIKHMGYRIELEEIEAAINRLPYARQTAVIYKRVRDGFGHIVAHVAADEPTLAQARLRSDLAAALPGYMIPTRFVVVRELPKNANGKVDRVLLRDL